MEMKKRAREGAQLPDLCPVPSCGKEKRRCRHCRCERCRQAGVPCGVVLKKAGNKRCWDCRQTFCSRQQVSPYACE